VPGVESVFSQKVQEGRKALRMLDASLQKAVRKRPMGVK
jgi:hypothetical protein